METMVDLDHIKDRCAIDGDCWIWKYDAIDGKHPRICINGKVKTVRRIVWELAKGPIPKKKVLTCGCTNPLCVSPECIKLTTYSAIRNGVKKSAAARLNIARAKRQSSDVTIDDVRAIRASSSPNRDIDQAYGKSRGWAAAIRRGKLWVDVASPFAGLGSRS